MPRVDDSSLASTCSQGRKQGVSEIVESNVDGLSTDAPTPSTRRLLPKNEGNREATRLRNMSRVWLLVEVLSPYIGIVAKVGFSDCFQQCDDSHLGCVTSIFDD